MDRYRSVFNRYRNVLLPLAITLLLDLLLLATNTVLTHRLELYASEINLAGRQRMLTQRISKSAALISYQQADGADTAALQQELEAAAALFDRTLQAFDEGGATEDASGKPLQVRPLMLPASRQTLAEAQAVWQPVRLQLQVAQQYEYRREALQHLLQFLSRRNLQLLTLMNDLTVQLEQEAAHQAQVLRYFQTLVVFTIFLLFLWVLRRLQRSDQYFTNLMEADSDIVLSLDIAGRSITFISRNTGRLLGYPDHYYLQRPMDRLFTRKTARQIHELTQALRRGEQITEQRLEGEVIQSSGSVLEVDCIIKVSSDAAGKPQELLIDVRDISERKKYERELETLAHRDALTGLKNRNRFFDFASQALLRAQRQQDGIAVLFIDLDGFKSVNDSHGHDTGDRLLQALAGRLVGCFRRSDTVCRLGGDEFVVLLEPVGGRESVAALCEKVIATLSQDVHVDGITCKVGASIGVAFYPQDGSRIDDLVTRADEAMYRAKAGGRGGFSFATEAEPCTAS